MAIVTYVLSIVLGTLSAFSVFAMGFNGYPWTYQAGIALLIAIASGVTPKFFKSWSQVISVFFIPYVLLFGLLLMGSFEKGEWLPNLAIISVFSAAIWLPAFIGGTHGHRS